MNQYNDAQRILFHKGGLRSLHKKRLRSDTIMKILIPVDDSAVSAHALAYIAERHNLENASELILLHVQEPLSKIAAHLMPEDVLKEYYTLESEKVFAPIRSLVQSQQLKAKEMTVVGTPAEEIARVAQQMHADLIVMGSRGLSAISGLLFGSVTNKLLTMTQTPILSLRNTPSIKDEPMQIALAVDTSEYGRAMAQFVTEHADLLTPGTTIHVINVASDIAAIMRPGSAVTVSSMNETQAKEAEIAFAPVLPILKQANLKIVQARLVGDPPVEICDYCRDKKLDMLVLGSHGFGGLKSAALGSTAMRIASMAEIPLLIIRR